LVFSAEFFTTFALKPERPEGRPALENLAAGKPIREPLITLVASGLPTFYALPLAKCAAFA